MTNPQPTNPTSLTPSQMLEAIESCRPLAHSLARKFHMANRCIRPSDLNEVAMWALRLAALKFDASRGNKFITPAYQYIRFALIEFCRTESARGMHVPTDHEPYYAPKPKPISATREYPQRVLAAPVNELGEDFWKSVTRTLHSPHREVVLLLFRDGLRHIDVASKLNISRVRVGQLVDAAMVSLRRRDDLRELAGMGCEEPGCERRAA